MSVHRTSLLARRQVDDLSLSLSLSFSLSLSGSFFLCSWQEIIKNKLYSPGRDGRGKGGGGGGVDNQRKAFRLTNYTRTDNDFAL